MVKEGIYSPITQNERHLEVVKRVRSASKGNIITKTLFETKFDNNYKSLVVLANSKTVLNDRYAKKEIKQRIYRADQLIRVLKELDAEIKEFTYSEKEMFQLAQFFMDASIPNKSDYSKRYQELLIQCEEKSSKQIGNDDRPSICPKCGKELVIRTAKKGINVGNQFWGCSGFPKCKYIKNI